MSFIASMVSAAVAAEIGAGVLATTAGIAATGAAGAGLGAGVGALTGSDPGQGALMGGIGGLALGAAGPVMAPELAASGTEAGVGLAGGAVPSNFVAGDALSAGVTTTPLAESAPIVATPLEGSMPAVSAPLMPPATTAPSTISAALGQSAPQALPMSPVAPQLSSQAALTPLQGAEQLGATQAGNAASNLSLGQQVVQSLTGAAPDSAAVQYGGSALQGMATGAGIQGISNAVTGRPITEGMGTSALAGGIGGAAATGLASQAGQPAMMGKLGQFAAEHPMITSGGIGLLATPMVGGFTGLDEQNTVPTPQGIKPNFNKFNANAYHRTAYAHGGDVPPSGISTLGDYSDGGRLLKGPGDGVSDDIPAVVGGREPARLAEGEFVIPARIVSELGNGSTDAGAKQLYAMMDRVQSARHRTMGKGKFSEDTHASRLLPA